jgi:hypothetical protein
MMSPAPKELPYLSSLTPPCTLEPMQLLLFASPLWDSCGSYRITYCRIAPLLTCHVSVSIAPLVIATRRLQRSLSGGPPQADMCVDSLGFVDLHFKVVRAVVHPVCGPHHSVPALGIDSTQLVPAQSHLWRAISAIESHVERVSLSWLGSFHRGRYDLCIHRGTVI